MENVLEEKKAITIIGNVYETYNYEMFRTIEGNRDTNKTHIKRLMSSMEEMYLMSPIIVNSKMEIIDGQHRYESAKNLELPIRYIVDISAGLRAVQLLNAKNKDWTPTDYMESYIKLGNKDYILYKEFKEKYKLPHQVCQVLLNGSFGRTVSHGFNNGEFKIQNLEYSETVAQTVTESYEYYQGSKRRSYVYAIAKLSKKEEFNSNKYIRKLKIQQSKMYDCSNTAQYIELIESIYNYKNRKKVNLRF